jgi:uncharacterized protein (TIGR02118 family)
MFCVRRHPDITEGEFHRYWLEEHGPLVTTFAEALGIRRYVQSHTFVGPVGPALAATRGAPEAFDGVAELWFDSIDALFASASSTEGAAAGSALLADEVRFIDHANSPLFVCEEHVIIGD